MRHILFLCTGNSCRSQMAEAWAKYLYPNSNKYKFYSAGTVTHGLNPRAVQVMLEAGIDISEYTSKTTTDLHAKYPDVVFDIVFTVCDNAREACPVIPGGKMIHVGFDDPPYLARDIQDQQKILNVYRRVRDEIQNFLQNIEEYV